MNEVECINCMETWHEDELELMEDCQGFFHGCPVCGTDSYLTDKE